MRNCLTLPTIFGAVVCFFLTSLVVTTIASADSANLVSSGTAIELSEEMYGVNKYQVGRLVVHASPAKIQDVLTDYGRTAQMFTNVKQCRVIENHGPTKKISFVAAAPGNLWTFAYVLEVHESPGYIEWHRVSGAFKRNEGFWKLDALDGGQSTRVTYAKFLDSALVPQALVVRELRESMPIILSNLKTNAEG